MRNVLETLALAPYGLNPLLGGLVSADARLLTRFRSLGAFHKNDQFSVTRPKSASGGFSS